MPLPNAPPEDIDDRFNDILVSWAEAEEAQGSLNCDELAARYPEFAAELTEFVAIHERMEHLAAPIRGVFKTAFCSPPNPADTPGPRSSAEHTAVIPTDDGIGLLGDFRLIRQIGRGGMGIVYEAEQVSLCRTVAVKVLSFAGALDPRHLQRFKNEAQAAANLHHTNIVPVYFVGCDHGVHYYAMQLIEGCTLAGLVRDLRRQAGLGNDELKPHAESKSMELTFGPAAPEHATPADRLSTHSPLAPAGRGDGGEGLAPIPRIAAFTTEPSHKNPAFFRTIADLGIQAAEALEHAHQIGVVHRDIKPGNLLLDARRNLWVTDFGLAQFQTDSDLTMTGDLLGTLRYMSPEQAVAKRVVVDHRTDIYSLGVTLYELLSLEPAFAGKDRQELLRQITLEDPRPLRRINKSIPVELETIVLKAMEKNAADRYATAQEMADDLRRFLDDRPIQARGPTLRQKIAKWSRRHKTIVRSALALLALTTAVTTTAAFWIAHERNVTEEHRKTAVVERGRANREAAVSQAVNDFFNELLAGADPKNTRDPNRKLRSVLDEAGKRIEGKFADQPLVEARLRQTLANTYLSLGLYGEAERHAIRARQLTADALDSGHRAALESSNILATVYRKEGRLSESRQLHEETLARRRRSLGPQDADTQKSLDNLGLVLHNQGHLTEARKLYEEVVAVRRQALGVEDPDTVRAMGNLGLVLDDVWDLEEARKLDAEIVDVRRRTVGPEDPYTLLAMDNLAVVLAHQGRLEDARKLHEEALAVQQRTLGPRHPETLHTMNNLAWALCVLPLSKPENIIRALQLAKEVVKHTPDSGSNWNTLGVAYYRSGDWHGAIAALKQSQGYDSGKDVANNGLFLAMAHWKLGDKPQARTCYDRAVAWMEKNAANNKDLKRFRAEAEELMGMRKK
jgi:serine/threonine protein kinase/Tfp pilus assembly protein PilF